MAQLILNNVDEATINKLKRRAAAHGRSIEAEHRAILCDALGSTPKQYTDFKAALLAMPNMGDDADFHRIQDSGRQ